MKPDIGIYYDLADHISGMNPPSLSYLAREWPELEAWRTMGRAKVLELLAFNPPGMPLNATVDSKREDGDLVVEEISYDMPYGPRVRGLFIYPKNRGEDEKMPAVVALHDHGGFKYFGKEKIAAIPNEPHILHEFKKECYGGRSWATELAKRGFAVLAVDAFLFGSRRIPVESLNEDMQKQFKGLEPDSREYIEKYNHLAAELEHIIAKTIFAAGSTWPGIFTYEDRRSVDYLLTRPEVDSSRIGCGGLSGGGLRTIFLAGLDPRVKCAICVGFMSTFREMLRNHIKCHTWMLYVPHLPRFLDMPDLISLHAPAPLMVQYNMNDELYTLEGQREADQKLRQIYGKMGHPDNYCGKFYQGPHKFDVEMQEDAFKWFEKWLK
ncbi:acetylxylan esterase [Candidatus Bathyarchaeota archaeon]|nr:acetylxylan esterase [Candidatus Bathyarchaeota archaeon]